MPSVNVIKTEDKCKFAHDDDALKLKAHEIDAVKKSSKNQTKPPVKKPNADPKKSPKGEGKGQKVHAKPKGETPCAYEPGSGSTMERPGGCNKTTCEFLHTNKSPHHKTG